MPSRVPLRIARRSVDLEELGVLPHPAGGLPKEINLGPAYPGYVLVRRKFVGRVLAHVRDERRTPFIYQYDVRRARWGAARCLQPKEASGTPGRYDLEVQLCRDHVRFWTSYHRLVGMTLLQCWHDSYGNLLTRGYTVPPHRWGDYHAHHRNANAFDVSLSNVVIVDRVKLHPLLTAGMVLPEPPVGWGFTSLI